MVLIKALASAIALALFGLLIGPILAVLVTEAPAGDCGLYWLIPVALGAIWGVVVGAVAGFLLGLVF